MIARNKRLITLTGFGGVGKSRTALDVAERLAANGANPVWLVELAAVTDPALVVETIAATLDVPLSDKNEAPEALAAALKERRMVLVIDCCEHVLPAVAAIARAILQGCPEITIMATSRERLGIAGETVYRIVPLIGKVFRSLGLPLQGSPQVSYICGTKIFYGLPVKRRTFKGR